MNPVPPPPSRRTPKVYRRYYSYALSDEDKEALKSRPSPSPKRGSGEVIAKVRRRLSSALFLGATKDSVDDEAEERLSLTADQEARDLFVAETHLLTAEVRITQIPANRATPARAYQQHKAVGVEKNAYREFQGESSDVREHRTRQASNEAQWDLTSQAREFIDGLPTFPLETPPDSPPEVLSRPTQVDEEDFTAKAIPRRSKALPQRPQSYPGRSCVQTPRAFQHNSSVTFDSMLTAHVTGKGEAYLGAENAKKNEENRRPRLSIGRGYFVPGRGQGSRAVSG